jgi:hypothetical protein
MPIRNLRQKDTADLFPKKESVATLHITQPNELVGATKNNFWRLCAAPLLEHVHSIGGRGEKASCHTVITPGYVKHTHVCTNKSVVTDSRLTCSVRMNDNDQKVVNMVDWLGNEKGFSSIGMLKADCSS